LIGFGTKNKSAKIEASEQFTLINVFSFKLPFDVEFRGFSFAPGCEVIVVYHLT
jgi:hypothetical protein